MNALEKLGWTLEYACTDKTDEDYGLIIYQKDDEYIRCEVNMLWGKYSHSDFCFPFTSEELLALAEIIKEEEKK